MAASQIPINQSLLNEIRELLESLPQKPKAVKAAIDNAVSLPQKLIVSFGGVLAEKFTNSFEWTRQGLTDQISDAIKTMSVNYPGMQSFLYECDRLGQMFAVSVDGQWCADDLDFVSYLGNARTIHVEPLMGGAGGNLGNLIKGVAGAALIGIGIAAGSTGVLGIPGTTLIITGSSMLLSAAAGALFNRPMIKKDDADEDKRKSSYFSTSSRDAAGKVIPRLYGCSTRELVPGTPVAIGRRIPVNPISRNINYVKITEEDD
jgi:predicted phage tail protein